MSPAKADDTSSDSVVTEASISLFFQNVQGFIGKRSMFLNSSILDLHQIAIIQETNIHSERHKNFENLQIRNWTGFNLTTVDSGKSCRGALLGFRNDLSIPIPTKVEIPPSMRDFDLGCYSFDFKTKRLNVISAYRSPSMSDIQCDEFFTAIQTLISSISGLIILVGDLNVVASRPFICGLKQNVLLKRITDAGLTNKFRGVTRNASNEQLDYIFANFDVRCDLVPGIKSDHYAITTSFTISYELLEVPLRVISSLKDCSVRCIRQLIQNAVSVLLTDPGISNAELLIEYEMLIYDIVEELGDHRVVKAHSRIAGLSRQISKHILHPPENMTREEYSEKLRCLQKKDAARRMRKYMSSQNLGVAIQSIFAKPSKKSSMACAMHPREFTKKILKDEMNDAHSLHRPHLTRPEILKKSVCVDSIANKFRPSILYNNRFWQRIADNMFTDRDADVNQYSMVEVVTKDAKKSHEIDGWRIIWKSPPTTKFYDLIRSHFISTEAFENAAYTGGASTQVTLSKIFSMEYGKNEGLFGADFANAFASACRNYLNDIVDAPLLPKKINFDVFVGDNSDCGFVSHWGTGAGRPSGGPAFNAILDSHFRESETNLDSLAAYADDSQAKTPLDKKSIQCLLDKFVEAKHFGLQVHLEGNKGPTLLVRKENVGPLDIPTHVTAVNRIKFLGINISIGPHTSLIGSFPEAVIQSLYFHARTLGTGLRLARLNASMSEWLNVYKMASRSIAALIESRFQYAVCYLGSASLYRFYTIHRAVICNLLDISPSFFGFRTSKERLANSDKYVIKNLGSELEKLESNTYKTLCAIAGRPTLRQLCLRACVVISRQCPFTKWNLAAKKNAAISTRPRISIFQQKIESFIDKCKDMPDMPGKELLTEFLDCKSTRRRRGFIKLCTDRLFKVDLKKRGFEVNDMDCSLCKRQKRTDISQESLDHMMAVHFSDNRSLTKLARSRRIHGNIRIAGRARAEQINCLFSHVDNEVLVRSTPRKISKKK